jgi:ActR/RegA family two-component response regulator
MHRYALRDDQWERIKAFLSGRKGHVGGTADRLELHQRGRPLHIALFVDHRAVRLIKDPAAVRM